MKIGVIGAGNIGGTIGKKWAAAGHEVVFGVRDVNAPKVKGLLDSVTGQATAVSVNETIDGCDILLFSVPSSAMENTVTSYGPSMAGKIIIDATNKIGQPVMNSLDSLRKHAAGAKLYRAFNNLGWENFENPQFGDETADLFYCGDSGEAQQVVDGLIAAVGVRPVYVGGVDRAPVIDALTSLWFALAVYGGRDRHLAFKMLEDN